MQNEGKKFEKDFKDSVPDDVWYYRFRDGTATFYGGMEQDNGLRFQQSNICDCELFMKQHGLFLLELKSHMGKSLPYSVFKEEHLKELAKALNYGIATGAVINMREVGKTYFLSTDAIIEHMNTSGRKSIPLDYMRERGYRLKAEQKRVRWRYDVKDMIEQIRLDR